MIQKEAQQFLIAVQFLTRLPVAISGAWPDDWLVRSAKYMPLVGALIGVAAAGIVIGSASFFPAPLPVLIGLVAALVLTGALHEDGLADTADAIAGGQTRERRLEIMRDSRIGSFGAVALIVAIGLKAAALASLDAMSAALVLISAHAAARLASVLALAVLEPARETAKVSGKASSLTWSEIAFAIVTGLIPGAVLLGSAAFVIPLIAAALAVIWLAILAKRAFGGYTGDVLGAIEQVFEVVFFMFAAAVISGPG
ncbi:adenosylcobinamide-GDP ribazoletransferase [Hyphomicrobium methylovorum]|uniref:adenosylcobinamide-GDP ribazoletransferase n=1 Tax=Hyphomicrobium methylovorum TaxID=84 RepID=UPI0015E70761|nr:adenosylcobinamide-GDP ribazoletransferase [Hyphomicrobium methylovorum]MBA2126870.1 adenosylcobinamide-GDP ribazoletransferase [Hyphomicrobium methylovorum]